MDDDTLDDNIILQDREESWLFIDTLYSLGELRCYFELCYCAIELERAVLDDDEVIRGIRRALEMLGADFRRLIVSS